MKKYIRFLIVLCCVAAFLAVLPFFYVQAGLAARKGQVGERNNPDCVTDRRVFDYADVLTDRQEDKLQKLIDQKQEQLGLDIVIVTINENVGSDPYDSSYNNTIYFAENFYEYFKFGYDGHRSDPNADLGNTFYSTAGNSTGAGVIYVDNWYDLNGYAESAFLAYRGASDDSFYDRAYEIYLNQEELEELEEDVWEYSNVNPYRSYRRMLNHLAADMVGPNVIELHIKDGFIFLIPLIIVAIFLLINLGKKLGKKTTNMSTYVQGGQANLTAKRDIFLSKHTTQRHIDTSSGGGGGGGGGGGHSGGHSGGGGRH